MVENHEVAMDLSKKKEVIEKENDSTSRPTIPLPTTASKLEKSNYNSKN
jgi:hypothetical protein